MECKYYFRDQIQYFKKNKNFATNQGVMCYQYYDDRVEVQVFSLASKINDSLYKFYNQFKKNFPTPKAVTIVQYFQVDEEKGKDVDDYVEIVKQEISFIANNKIMPIEQFEQK